MEDIGSRFICLIVGIALTIALLDHNWLAMIIGVPVAVWFVLFADDVL